MSNVMAKEVYSLAEITGTLLDMRDNCFPKDGDTYDDPRRNEKHAALNIAIDLINNPSRLENMSNWISVKDRVPDDDNHYLTYTTEHICAVYRYDGDGEWVTDWGDTANHDITHWMPLPEPPKEAEHE